MLKVALIEPEIPWNTGNIGRTCLAAGAELHLVGRLGFEISERRLRRAGMDYWKSLSVTRHDSIEAFTSFIKDAVPLAFCAEAPRTHWEAPYAADSWLVFGSESRGLPPALRERWRESSYRIPMEPGARSLNLSTAAAIALYEARRTLAASSKA